MLGAWGPPPPQVEAGPLGRQCPPSSRDLLQQRTLCSEDNTPPGRCRGTQWLWLGVKGSKGEPGLPGPREHQGSRQCLGVLCGRTGALLPCTSDPLRWGHCSRRYPATCPPTHSAQPKPGRQGSPSPEWLLPSWGVSGPGPVAQDHEGAEKAGRRPRWRPEAEIEVSPGLAPSGAPGDPLPSSSWRLCISWAVAVSPISACCHMAFPGARVSSSKDIGLRSHPYPA